MLKCSYITENGKYSKDTFNINSEYVDIINNQVKKETKVMIDGISNILPPGLLLHIHELVR
jgi:disulfide oxidoreductase YuzD